MPIRRSEMLSLSPIQDARAAELAALWGHGQYVPAAQEENNSGYPEGSPAVILNLSDPLQQTESPTYSMADIVGQNRDESELTDHEKREVQELEARDREVRQHEQTHAAMLGQYARGGPTYTYQMGPDGKTYAVGGSVEADTGKESTPEETIAKAQVLRMASTAVGNPSPEDLVIAGQAARMEAGARAKL